MVVTGRCQKQCTRRHVIRYIYYILNKYNLSETYHDGRSHPVMFDQSLSPGDLKQEPP
jgi:hypothetical protein